MTNRSFIFCVAPLLPVACHFLARDCEPWRLKTQYRFKFEGLACDLSQSQRSRHFSLLPVSRIWQDSILKGLEFMEPGEPENGKRFFPSGAIFFFALLVLFYAALWLVVYWIMIARA
jgi:hypothetical protein